MERDYTIMMFLKFGREQDITDLFENGTIYINSIQNFRKIEDGYLRGDRYEGVSSIRNSSQAYIEILGKKIDIIGVHLPIAHEVVFGNIYSLYCVSSHGFKTPADFKIDERVRKFGSHCIIITQPGEFLSRIEKKLKLIGLSYKIGFVEYYDRHAINGQVNLFQKPNEYEYQKEFRLYVSRKEITPLIFQIGSLKDIADVFQSDITSKIELRPALK